MAGLAELDSAVESVCGIDVCGGAPGLTGCKEGATSGETFPKLGGVSKQLGPPNSNEWNVRKHPDISDVVVKSLRTGCHRTAYHERR